jgi:hypothetical protein
VCIRAKRNYQERVAGVIENVAEKVDGQIDTQRPVPETLLGRDGQIATSCTGDVAEKVKRN